MNRLLYGNHLDVMRRGQIVHESVDLIYLDPPLNSQREFNQFMREADGSIAASQRQAFLDSWDWTQGAATYDEITKVGGNTEAVFDKSKSPS
jgi:DNA modification methylase